MRALAQVRGMEGRLGRGPEEGATTREDSMSRVPSYYLLPSCGVVRTGKNVTLINSLAPLEIMRLYVNMNIIVDRRKKTLTLWGH